MQQPTAEALSKTHMPTEEDPKGAAVNGPPARGATRAGTVVVLK